MSHPYMPLYVADYLSATEHLDAALSGAYLHLIMHHWQKGCLPTEDRLLCRIARMTPRQWASAKPILQAFFEDDWTNTRVKMELDKANRKALVRATLGSQGGHAKALKNKGVILAKATPELAENPSKSPSKTLPFTSGLELDVEPNGSTRESARARFDRFWSAWPNKTQKPYAEKCFAKVADEIDAILAGIDRYKRTKPPDRPWLNPSTFLNQRRWADEPAGVELPLNGNHHAKDPFDNEHSINTATVDRVMEQILRPVRSANSGGASEAPLRLLSKN